MFYCQMAVQIKIVAFCKQLEWIEVNITIILSTAFCSERCDSARHSACKKVSVVIIKYFSTTTVKQII